MRKLPNCFPRHFTFLPQCLMILFFHISTNIRHFVLILTSLLCVWGGLVCELPRPLFSLSTYSSSVSLFSIICRVCYHSHLGSVGTFLNLYSPLKFLVSKSLWYAFAPVSPSLDLASFFPLEVLWELTSQWMQSRICFPGCNSSRM